MGFEADRAMDDLLLDEVDKQTWTTKDGQVIAYNQLEDSHLINIIRMLGRNLASAEDGDSGFLSHEYMSCFRQDYIDMTEDRLYGLRAEATRRGLEFDS